MNKVICGANEREADLTGQTIAQIRAEYNDILNIDPNARVLLSGDFVDNEYVIQEGDTLEFVKAAGNKGR